MYYLQSRYYDPALSRFICSDDILSNEIVLGLNLFSYCENQPISCKDSRGYAKTYVIYYESPTSGFEMQANNSPYFDADGDVEIIGVATNEDFTTAWNNLEGDIDYIFLYLHGGEGVLFFKEGGIDFTADQSWADPIDPTKYISYENLQPLTVNKSVYLLSCKGGKGTPSNNVAWKLSNLTGASVLACSGSVSFSKFNDKYYARKAFGFGDVNMYTYRKLFYLFGPRIPYYEYAGLLF